MVPSLNNFYSILVLTFLTIYGRSPTSYFNFNSCPPGFPSFVPDTTINPVLSGVLFDIDEVSKQFPIGTVPVSSDEPEDQRLKTNVTTRNR